MTETIQQLKEDIAILQEKLQKLEEQDPEMLLLRQGKVDVVIIIIELIIELNTQIVFLVFISGLCEN